MHTLPWGLQGHFFTLLSEEHRVNLFAGKPSRDVTEADLRALFEPFGTLGTVTIVKDKFSGVSKGFGFVEVPVKAEAEAATAGLYRTQFRVNRSISPRLALARSESRGTEVEPAGVGVPGRTRRQ